LIVYVGSALQEKYQAGTIVRELAAVVGGKGGGRPELAQAGGPQAENLDQALAKVRELL